MNSATIALAPSSGTALYTPIVEVPITAPGNGYVLVIASSGVYSNDNATGAAIHLASNWESPTSLYAEATAGRAAGISASRS